MEVSKSRRQSAGTRSTKAILTAGLMALVAHLGALSAFAEEAKQPAAPAEQPAVEQAAAVAPAEEKPVVEKAAAAAPAETPAAKPATPTPAKSPEEELSKDEKTVLDLVNDHRRRMGLRQFRVNTKLMRTARSHSNNMARWNQMSHYLGGSVGQRAVANGYPSSYAGENIAQGQRGAHQVMSVWMASSGHRNNILSGGYTEIGIGVAYSSRGVPYWTQVFGRQ